MYVHIFIDDSILQKRIQHKLINEKYSIIQRIIECVTYSIDILPT